MLKISCAACHSLSLVISAQLVLKMGVAARNRKKSIKSLF